MDKVVILHNEYDSKSREFVSKNLEYQIINWYEESDSFVEYTSKNLPKPSIFPCVVDTEFGLIVNDVLNMSEALEEISVKSINKMETKNMLVEISFRFEQTRWLVERHEEQLKLGIVTSLTTDQYNELLMYRQGLRGVNNQTNFPVSVNWPNKPDFLV